MKYNEFICKSIINNKEFSFKYSYGKITLFEDDISQIFNTVEDFKNALDRFKSDTNYTSTNDKIYGKFEFTADGKSIENPPHTLEDFLCAVSAELDLTEQESSMCNELGPVAYAYLAHEG